METILLSAEQAGVRLDVFLTEALEGAVSRSAAQKLLETGGVTRERMPEAFAAGNVLCAAGFDVVLKGENPETITPERVAQLLCAFVESAKAARAAVNPQLSRLEELTDEEFLAVLPNYCSVI